MRAAPWWMWWLLGAVFPVVAYFAANAMRDPSMDEMAASLRDGEARVLRVQRDEALARADSAAMLVVRERLALQDSTERWAAERATLRATVSRETAHHSALADSLRLRVDSASAVLVTAMEAAHAESLAASEERARTWEAEARAKDVEISLQSEEIRALREALSAEIARSSALSAGNESLRRALAGERREGNVVKLVGGGLLALAVYDRTLGG